VDGEKIRGSEETGNERAIAMNERQTRRTGEE
jgi:hypothetical protein